LPTGVNTEDSGVAANRRLAEGWLPSYQRQQKRMAPELAAL
jgi:hypothetical protein